MQDAMILWIDLTSEQNTPCLGKSLTDTYSSRIVIARHSEIEANIAAHEPQLLCFDFDFPDPSGLNQLQSSKTRHPDIPIIMLTKDHSAELVIWALRSRVWNYYIKPVAIDKLLRTADLLLKQHETDRTSRRNMLMPTPESPAHPGAYVPGNGGGSTDHACCYVQQHLDEKITLEQVAELCSMSRSWFSRTFRSEHGITFQEYLVQQRIHRAVYLLRESDLQVTQIALAVGFSDLSYFSRTFKRHVGVLPTGFRKDLTSGRVA